MNGLENGVGVCLQKTRSSLRRKVSDGSTTKLMELIRKKMIMEIAVVLQKSPVRCDIIPYM